VTLRDNEFADHKAQANEVWSPRPIAATVPAVAEFGKSPRVGSWQARFVAAMRDGVRVGRAIGLTTHPPEQNAREGRHNGLRGW